VISYVKFAGALDTVMPVDVARVAGFGQDRVDRG